MPKRLSDITHAFERTSLNLEETQDELTRLTERAQAQVNGAAEAHRAANKDLLAYLTDHPSAIVVAGDYGYALNRGMVARLDVVWAHHVWVDDPTPAPSYRVPTAAKPWPNMAAVLEPRAGEAGNMETWTDHELKADLAALRADEAGDLSAEGEAALDAMRATWEEPNGEPVTID